MTPRSVRNNNPGNLNRGQPWQGLQDPTHMTPEQKAETRFAVFVDPEHGFRAMAKLLMNYETMYGVHTIAGAINRWAPPFENNTKNYIDHVCNDLGVRPNQVVSLRESKTLCALLTSISTMEAGGWYFTAEQVAKGVELAGA